MSLTSRTISVIAAASIPQTPVLLRPFLVAPFSLFRPRCVLIFILLDVPLNFSVCKMRTKMCFRASLIDKYKNLKKKKKNFFWLNKEQSLTAENNDMLVNVFFKNLLSCSKVVVHSYTISVSITGHREVSVAHNF